MHKKPRQHSLGYQCRRGRGWGQLTLSPPHDSPYFSHSRNAAERTTLANRLVSPYSMAIMGGRANA